MRDVRAIVVAALASFASTALGQITVAGVTPASARITEAGAAAYTIPIRVPPGSAGLEPRLALTYNSQGINGLLGAGWSLSGLSTVYRCSKTIVQDGFTSGIYFNVDDRFCIDGQRLVAVSGSYGGDGVEHRTEREAFTKVVSYATGPSVWFKAWTKAGLVMEYGNTADSWIEAQGRSIPRAWAVNKVSDKAGNYFTVTYQEDTTNGDFRPARIDYTGNAGAGVAPFASVVFTYEDRTDIKPAYVAASAIKTMKRLTNIKTYVGASPVTSYRLVYNYSPSGLSRLASIQECDGAETQCISPISIAWQDPGGGGFSQTSLSGMPSGSLVPGDVNGDGLTDLVWLSGGTLYVAYATGSGFQAAVNIGSLAQGTPFYVADFDGNGRADILAQTGDIWLSTSSGFTQTSWGGIAFDVTGDFNGDGLADGAYVSAGWLYVRYSTGSGFQAPVSLGAAGWPIMAGDFDGNGRADIVDVNGTTYLSYSTGYTQNAWSLGISSGVAGDFNGDGLCDIAYESPPGTILIRYSNGNGFDGPSSFNTLPPGATYVVGDFDGNAVADFALSTSVSWTRAPATPDQVATITTSPGATVSFTYKPLSDTSVYAKDTDAAWPARDLKETGPTYAAPRIHAGDSGSVHDLKESGLIYVVSRVTATDGIGGSRITDYFYRGAKTHVTGGRFLGFRQIEATEQFNSNVTAVSSFGQDYPYHGLLTQSRRQQSSGSVLLQSDNTWTKTGLTPSGGSGGNYHKAELTQSVDRSYELNGSLFNTVTTSTSYDAYSNPGTVNVNTADGYSKSVSNTYSNDTSSWILGRLTNSSVTSTKPSGTAPLSLTRTFAFTYDPSTGLVTKEVAEPSDSNLCLVNVHGYDAFGNRSSTTTRNCNGSAGEAAAPTGDAVFPQRTSYTSFNATTANPTAGQFPTSSTNALSQVTSREFDSRFGAPTRIADPNSLSTQWSYDILGRKATETRVDGTTSTWSWSLCGTCPANGRYFVTATTTGAPTANTYFDSLNRAIRSETGLRWHVGKAGHGL